MKFELQWHWQGTEIDLKDGQERGKFCGAFQSLGGIAFILKEGAKEGLGQSSDVI